MRLNISLVSPKLQKRTFRDQQPGFFNDEEDRLPPIISHHGMDIDVLYDLLNNGLVHIEPDGTLYNLTGSDTIRALHPDLH